MDIWERLGFPPEERKPGSPFTPRATCARGHSMDDAYTKKDSRTGKQRRECRTCKLDRDRRRFAW